MPNGNDSVNDFQRFDERQLQILQDTTHRLDQRIARLETKLTAVIVLLATNWLGISLENAHALLNQLSG